MAKTYRRLHQMNGDYLTQLKRPLCSEFSIGVKGTINAKKEEHRKKVSLLFKDRNFVINKINRSQDAVYGTLLRVHKQKKMMQREKCKRMQDEARASLNDDVNGTKSVSVQGSNADKLIVNDSNSNDMKQRDVVQKAESNSDNRSSVQQKNSHGNGNNPVPSAAINNKSKVLEVQKDLSKPVVRERSMVEDSLDKSHQNPSLSERANSTFDPFPKISEQLLDEGSTKYPSGRDNSNEGNSEAQYGTQLNHSKEPNLSKDSTSSKSKRKSKIKLGELKSKKTNKTKVAPPTSYLLAVHDNVHSPLTAISEERSDNPINLQPQQPTSPDDITDAAALRASWPSSISTSYYKTKKSEGFGSGQSGSLSERDPISLVELNKIRAKEMEVWRKESLNKEPINQYVMDKKGQVVKDIKDFHRKDFQPPSMKERHFQNKMLLSQLDAKIQQRMRIEDFFGQIEADMEKYKARKKALAKLATDKIALEEAEEKKRREQETIGVTLAVLTAAFNRVERLPSNVDPDSVQALKVCKYTREYKPLTMTKEEKKQAQRHKTSSWATPGLGGGL